jgi:hypothetical protein
MGKKSADTMEFHINPVADDDDNPTGGGGGAGGGTVSSCMQCRAFPNPRV